MKRVEIAVFDWTRAETLDFASRMRPDGRREFFGMTGADGEAIADAVRADVDATAQRGGISFGARLGGLPCAVFAAAPDSAMSDAAAVWMLSSRECEAHRVAFGRWSVRCFRELCAALPGVATFWNWTQDTGCPQDTRRWLAWLGAWFSASDYWISPWTGERFVKFAIPKGESSCQYP